MRRARRVAGAAEWVKRGGQRRGAIVGTLLLIVGLIAAPGESAAQRGAAVQIMEHADEILEATLAEFLFQRDSVEGRAGNRASLGTLLAETGGDLLLSVRWEHEGRALAYFEGVEAMPDLRGHAEVLAAAITARGVPTHVDEGQVAERCVWHPGTPTRERGGSPGWNECRFPPGVGAMLDLAYPVPMGHSPDVVEWVIVYGQVFHSHERDPDGVGINTGHALTVRLEHGAAGREVVGESGARVIDTRPPGRE